MIQAGEYEYKPDPMDAQKAVPSKATHYPDQPFKPSAATSGKPFNHIEVGSSLM